jgi:hypothetical protein
MSMLSVKQLEKRIVCLPREYRRAAGVDRFSVRQSRIRILASKPSDFLHSNLRIEKWIYGTDYSGRDVDRALKIAAGQSDWLGEHSEWLYAILLFAGYRFSASRSLITLCSSLF